jgi:hypothetical protein
MPPARAADRAGVDGSTTSAARELARLEEEERLVSAQRRRVQDRIDVVLGAAGADGAGADLRDLRERERELSARRRDLHGRIDELRALLEPEA